MDELDKAHQAILQDKDMYLTKLVIIGAKLIAAGNREDANTIKEAVDFFKFNMK